MAANHSLSASRMLEASHRPKPLLEVAVVSLQTIIEVLRAAMLRAGEDSTNGGRIARRFVGYDALWHFACPGDLTFEERLRRSSVAPCAEVDVHDLALLIDRPITVGPSALEAAVSFIHAPLPPYRRSVRAGSLCEKRQESLYPAVDGAPIDHDATLGDVLPAVELPRP
jgi:hypothetical protein